MAETAVLGTIVKAVGLKGEVKLLPSPDFWPDALNARSLDIVTDGEERREVRVSRSRPKGGTFILKLEGIETIEAAEPLIGGSLEIALDALGGARLPDTALPFQLIGLDVRLMDGTPFGVVVDMLLGSAQDCLIIEKDGERYLVPHVPELVRSVSLDEGTLTIDPPEGLLDLRW
jgi:16S rRNA processing protein RimM